MFTISLGILVAGSLALQVEETKSVSSHDVLPIVHSIATVLSKQTGETILVHSTELSKNCSANDECINRILKESQANEVIFVSIEKKSEAFKIELKRNSGGGLKPRLAKVELPRVSWNSFLSGAASLLFPEGTNPTQPVFAAANREAMPLSRNLFPKALSVAELKPAIGQTCEAARPVLFTEVVNDSRTKCTKTLKEWMPSEVKLISTLDGMVEAPIRVYAERFSGALGVSIYGGPSNSILGMKTFRLHKSCKFSPRIAGLAKAWIERTIEEGFSTKEPLRQAKQALEASPEYLFPESPLAAVEPTCKARRHLSRHLTL